jgi:tetratricopeptide (TPR) repeat protein
VLRETVFDPRILTDSLHSSGFYSAVVDYAGDSALEAALEQRGDVRWVATLLTEHDVRLIKQWGLPEPWTTAWLQESLAATLGWIETPSSQRVPPISIPVSDIERHAKDAASQLLDRHLAKLPVCTPDMASSTYCRPSKVSIEAYRATYKPQNMAIADEILDRVPAELDLATAVALFGRPFQEPLRILERVRSAVETLNRGLALAGLLCPVPLAALWLLCSATHKSRLRWIGATLLLAALAAWAVSYAALSLLPQRLTAPENAALPAELTVPAHDLIFVILAAAQARVATGALVLGAAGLLLLWVPLLAPQIDAWTRAVPPAQTVRTGVVLLALAGVLWILYARAGARLYAQASQLYRDTDVAAANTLYRQFDRLYPFRLPGAGKSIVERARRDQYKTQLYVDAQAEYDTADWLAAVQHYEALLLTQPALKLRDSAEAQLAKALIQWARLHEAAGQHERALDRYRYLRDEDLGRGRQFDGQPIRTHRLIGNLYLDWGDAQLGQDPEAALATYRRALSDTDDPGVWALAEERMIGAYCAWNAQLRQAGDAERAGGVCVEFGLEFPALAPDPCLHPFCSRQP